MDALSATYWDAFLESNPLFATTLGDPRFDGRLPDPTPEGQAAARARYAAILAQADDLDANEQRARRRHHARLAPRGAPSPTSRSSTAGCSPGTWTRSTGSRSSCSRPASTSRPRPPPRRPPCSSAGAPCPPTRTPTRRRCGGPSRMGSWPAAPPWSGWWTSWPSCSRARTMSGRCWPRSPAPAPTASAASVPGRGADAAPGPRAAGPPRSASGSRPTCGPRSPRGSGRRSRASTTPSPPRSGPPRGPRTGPACATCPVARRPTGAWPARTPRWTRPRTSSTAPAWPRSSASTPSWPTSPAGRSAPATCPTRWPPCGATPRSTSRPARRCSPRRSPPSSGRPRPSPTGSAASPRRRARSCAWARTRRSTRPSPTTASRPTTARGPGSTTSTPRIRRPGRATRRRCSPTTSPSPGTTSRSPSPRSSRTCRRSGATSARPRSSRAGACTRSASATRWASTPATSTGSACSAFDAWRASRLVVDTGMHAMGWTRQQAIDFMLEHTALAPNNIANEVDRYIVMPGPGPRLQDGPAGAPAAPRRGPRAARGPRSTSAPSTTPSWATARSRCRPCVGSSRHWIARTRARARATASTPGRGLTPA